MEKPIELYTTEELRSALNEYARSLQPAPPALPLPPGTDREKLKTPEAEAQLSDTYVNSILSRKPETWTPTEREAVRAASNRALKELGY
jgi:hypothetical protein